MVRMNPGRFRAGRQDAVVLVKKLTSLRRERLHVIFQKKNVRDAHWKVEAKQTATMRVLDMFTDAASNDMVILFETCE